MATILPIGIGNVPNDGLGDYVRVAFDKCNQNFNALNVAPIPITANVITQVVRAGVGMTIGQPVYVSGANGTNVIVSLASNTTEMTSSKTLGLIAQNLALNNIGNVVTEGLLGGLNTGSAVAGDAVWLGVNGTLIYGVTNRPLAPAHLVFIGIVTRANNSNGEIYVKVQNGFELEELHNVQIVNPIQNNGITYDVASGLWKNQIVQKVIVSATPNTQVFNTTAETKIGSFFIPGNSFSATDQVVFQSIMLDKTVSTFNTIDKFNVYLSPVDGISGSRLMSFRGRTTTEFVNFSRNFSQFNGQLYGWNENDADESGIMFSSFPLTKTNFNYQQGYWIVISVQMFAPSQQWYLRSCRITN